MSAPAEYSILGQTITMPVKVRDAKQAASTFLVDATAAQKIVGPSGLTVDRKPFNKAIATLAIVDYIDNDLGAYKEIALAFMVKEHPDAGVESKSISTLIHRLPVSEEFTCEAGRTIWGFPKWITDVQCDFHDGHASAVLRQDGTDVVSIKMNRGPIPVPAKQMDMVSYSFDDHGVLRRNPWTSTGETKQYIRPGGCTVEVGYGHPMADELRSLGFPKRAMLTIFNDKLEATFGEPEVMGS